MKLKNQEGFTLVEVMVVIIVMALLSVLALPRVISIITQAKKASAHSIVAAVRSGIANNKIASISEGNPTGVYPLLITSNASGDVLCGNIVGGCFNQILHTGQQVTDNRWNQTQAGGPGANAIYVFDKAGSAECTYTYNATNGTFLASNTTGCQ